MLFSANPRFVLCCFSLLSLFRAFLSYQSVGGSVIGLPEVARPGLVHTGSPCSESPGSPAPALRGCVLPMRATLAVSPMGFIPASPANPQHPSLRLSNLPAGPSQQLMPRLETCFDAPGMCVAPWGQLAGDLRNILLLSRSAPSVKAITEHVTTAQVTPPLPSLSGHSDSCRGSVISSLLVESPLLRRCGQVRREGGSAGVY